MTVITNDYGDYPLDEEGRTTLKTNRAGWRQSGGRTGHRYQWTQCPRYSSRRWLLLRDPQSCGDGSRWLINFGLTGRLTDAGDGTYGSFRSD